MKKIRTFVTLIVTLCLLAMGSVASYAKVKIKVKLNCEPVPLAGSQEAVTKLEKWGKKKGNSQAINYSTSIEPVHWQGEEKAPPKIEEVKVEEETDYELLFTPAAEKTDDATAYVSPLKNDLSRPATVHGVDFSNVVENGGANFALKSDTTHVHTCVTQLNQEIFSHYKEQAKVFTYVCREKPRIISPAAFDEREANMIVTYKGFHMTKKTAHCFKTLEQLLDTYFPGRTIIITCTTGGMHLDPKHYQGKAVDFVVIPLTIKESILVEGLAEQAGFVPYNEYLYSSLYKTGDHMHIDLDDRR